MYCCDTGELPAIVLSKMKRVDSETLRLAEELQTIINGLAFEEEGEITLKVQHRWVSAIGTTVRRFRKRLRTVD